jgi:hypothetical protein
MVATNKTNESAVQSHLRRLVEEHEAWLQEIKKTHPNPAQELDDFVRENFDPRVLASVIESWRNGDDEDDPLDGW